MRNIKKYFNIISIFKDVILRYPLRSLIFLLCTLLLGTTQVISIGAIYPILTTIVAKGEANNPIVLFFNTILVFFHLPLNIFSYIVLFLILGFISNGVYILVDIFQGTFLRFLEYNEAKSIFKTIIYSKWSVLCEITHGHFLNVIGRDTEQVIKIIKADFLVFSGIIQAAFYLGYAYFFNWRLSIFCTLFFGISSIVFFPMFKKGTRLGVKWGETNIKLNENLLNIARSFKDTKASSNENKMFLFIKPFLYNMANVYYKQGILSTLQAKISELIGTITLGILLYIGVELLKTNFVDLALILVIFSRTIPKIRAVVDDFYRAIAHVPAIWRIDTMKKRCLLQTRDTGKMLSECLQSIVLKNVYFSYKKDREVINNLSVKFNKGEFWAICGESGVGKTTVLDLILGIIEPVSGSIVFNSININDIKLESLHRKIGYLSQSNFIFAGTLKENITWGNETTDADNINQAINITQLRNMVDEKGLGFDITESGHNLSGGQRQRVSIARILLKEYDFILMDEPTSALDPETEEKFILALSQLKGKIGIIMVTHRPEYLKHADHILQFNENGIEVERTTKVQ